MQARLQSIRFPTLLFAVIFALAAAVALGGTLGYVLKPPTLVHGRTQVIEINPTDACMWIDGHKAC